MLLYDVLSRHFHHNPLFLEVVYFCIQLLTWPLFVYYRFLHKSLSRTREDWEFPTFSERVLQVLIQLFVFDFYLGFFLSHPPHRGALAQGFLSAEFILITVVLCYPVVRFVWQSEFNR